MLPTVCSLAGKWKPKVVIFFLTKNNSKQTKNSEPGNLLNLNTRRHSGFQQRAIDIQGNGLFFLKKVFGFADLLFLANGKGITVATKSAKNANKPNKVFTTAKVFFKKKQRNAHFCPTLV